MISKYELITFDLDDTLLGTEETIEYRVSSALRVAGTFDDGILCKERATEIISVVRAINPASGERLPTLLECLGVELSSQLVEAVRAEYYDSLFRSARFVEDARSTIDRLGELTRVGIITNGPSVLQRRKLDHFFSEFTLDPVLISGDFSCAKPCPEIFLEAANRAGVDPGACVHVGDSLETDVRGSNRAGFSSVWFRGKSEFNRCEDEVVPDFTVETLSDVVRFVEGAAEGK